MQTETSALNEAEELRVHRCSEGKEEKMGEIISRPCDENSVFVFPSLPLCLFLRFKEILGVPSTVTVPLPPVQLSPCLTVHIYICFMHLFQIPLCHLGKECQAFDWTVPRTTVEQMPLLMDIAHWNNFSDYYHQNRKHSSS